MTFSILQEGEKTSRPVEINAAPEVPKPYLTDSELNMIKFKLRENIAVAMEKQHDGGTIVHPIILAARKTQKSH